MAYRAIFGVQVHSGDQILVAWLNGILEPFSVALERGVQRRVCNPAFQGAGLLSAFAGTMPAFTAKYPMPTSTTNVKIMSPAAACTKGRHVDLSARPDARERIYRRRRRSAIPKTNRNSY